LVPGTPAQLNEWLRTGQIDLGPVSSIAYARNHQSLVLLPDLSIAAEGEVGSVLLFSKDRIDRVDGHKIALTTSSAAGAALVKVLCQYYYHIKAQFVEMAPDLDSMLQEASACLLIGDDALRARRKAQNLVVEDLGKAWWVLTGLPMVFAVWAVRREVAESNAEELKALVSTLREARRMGQENLPTVIEAAKPRTGLTEEELRNYYTLQKYDLGPRFRKGLLSYYNLAAAMGLAPKVDTLEFCTTC
jgi:chorismate dehydratase